MNSLRSCISATRRQPDVLNEFYAFIEDHHKANQVTFDLKYISVYTIGDSPPMVEMTEATVNK